MTTDTDIVIVGGGPVGAALALALRAGGDNCVGASANGLRVTVLEARTAVGRVAAADADPRPIALSHGSRLLLERLGAWTGLTPTAINHIHVSQRGGFGRVAISAADAGVPALGYVIDYGAMFAVLAEAARASGCDYRQGARVTALRRTGDAQHIDTMCDGVAASLTAHLVVVADGGDMEGLAPAKTIDYQQHALTARVRTALPHAHTAYERFTPEGPLALLPFCSLGDAGSGNDEVGSGHDNEMALVWTLTPARAEALQAADAELFLGELRQAFGGRLGDFTAVAQRACYPLALRTAAAVSVPGVVTIGNAAQTLHPVAGQGFNLGLRDAWELARLLRTLPVQTLAHRDTVRRYEASRRLDRSAAVATTHGFVRLFTNDFLPLRALRGAGLTLLGSIAPARDYLARRMIFGARG